MKIILSNDKNFELLGENVLCQIGDSVLVSQGQNPQVCSVGVFYVDAKEIQEINKEYRGKDKPTDVITFRLIDNPNNLQFNKENFPYEYDDSLGGFYIGEIFICADVAKLQAAEYNHSVNREVGELFVHGMLHMLGYDHENEVDREKMKTQELKQTALLDKLIK